MAAGLIVVCLLLLGVGVWLVAGGSRHGRRRQSSRHANTRSRRSQSSCESSEPISESEDECTAPSRASGLCECSESSAECSCSCSDSSCSDSSCSDSCSDSCSESSECPPPVKPCVFPVCPTGLTTVVVDNQTPFTLESTYSVLASFLNVNDLVVPTSVTTPVQAQRAVPVSAPFTSTRLQLTTSELPPRQLGQFLLTPSTFTIRGTLDPQTWVVEQR